MVSSLYLVNAIQKRLLKHQQHYRAIFSSRLLFMAALAGLLPDIDIVYHAAFYMAGVTLPAWLQHGGIFHTPLFALPFLVLGLAFLKYERPRPAVACFIITVGILLHILLDFVLGGGADSGIMWLFPFSQQGWSINILAKSGIPHAASLLDGLVAIFWLAVLETGVGLKRIME
ncbi:metal-dependent hydrolase [Candidatus Woesearchaeota archaeon]|nr:metal-dependent hydrolase [Candidatus Woesearchaeota archaeon]